MTGWVTADDGRNDAVAVAAVADDDGEKGENAAGFGSRNRFDMCRCADGFEPTTNTRCQSYTVIYTDFLVSNNNTPTNKLIRMQMIVRLPMREKQYVYINLLVIIHVCKRYTFHAIRSYFITHADP